MIIESMQEFEAVCKRQLATWYRDNTYNKIWPDDVFVVWSCKTLQNYKAMLAANVRGDGIYAEYTFNGDTGELYEDVYKKGYKSMHYGGKEGWLKSMCAGSRRAL